MPLTSARLQLLRIPRANYAKLFPDDNTPVRDFLAFKFAAQRASMYHTDPDAYFLSDEPTCRDADYSALSAPPATVIRGLIADIAEAEETDEYNSIACPHIPGNKQTYPLDLVSYWAELLEIFPKRTEYRNAVAALERRAKRENSSGATSTALEKLLNLPWNVTLRGFNERVPLSSLGRFCTRDWLQTRHIDLMLELLDLRGDVETAGIRVLPSEHAQDLIALYHAADAAEHYDTSNAYRNLRQQGQDFGTGVDLKLVTVSNINEDHWVGLVIDFEKRIVLYGDPFGSTIDTDLKDAYSWWLRQHNEKPFKWSHLSVTRQTDSYSCGVLAVNAVEHHLDPTIPLLEMADVRDERLRILTDVLTRHELESSLINVTATKFKFTFTHDLADGDIISFTPPTAQSSPESAIVGMDLTSLRLVSPGPGSSKADAHAPSSPTASVPLPSSSPSPRASPEPTPAWAEPPTPEPHVSLHNTEMTTPPPSPKLAPIFAQLSPAKGKVKRSTAERVITSPPPSPSKKRLRENIAEHDTLVSNTTQTLKGGEKKGLLRFFGKATADDLERMAQRDREHADRQWEMVADEAVKKARRAEQRQEFLKQAATLRKQQQRARERDAEIELGVRNVDGTRKRRKEVEPELHDPGVITDLAEKSRIRRAMKPEILAEHRTHASGRKRIHQRRAAKYTNWKTQWIYRQVLAAGRVNNNARTGLSAVGIVKTLQRHDYGLFCKLQPSTVQGWLVKNAERRNVWKEKVLLDVELQGDRPGHSCGGRRGVLSENPEVVEKIKSTLDHLRTAGAALSVITVRAVIIATITRMAPEIFEKTYHDNSQFHVSRDSFCRHFLRSEMRWSERQATNANQKLPTDWEDLCEHAVLRRAHVIKEEDIPPELIINTDQTGVVYNPGGRLTWAPRGSRQVKLISADEKRAFTATLAITASGTVLPIQAIFEGMTDVSCPPKNAPKYAESQAAGFSFVPSEKKRNHWANQRTMWRYACEIIEPYIDAQIARLGLPSTQKAYWWIDVWAVHRSEEFRNYMRLNHPRILIDFIPGGCTGVAQPLDVGINRPFKQSMKGSYHASVVDDLLGQLERDEDVHFDTHIGPLRKSSVAWLYDAFQFIQKPELVKNAFLRCAVRGWNLSYNCLPSSKIKARLRDERDNKTAFWQELQSKRGDEINIPEDVEVAEDRLPDLKMDECDGVDDSDIPLSKVVADVAGKKKGRVVRKAGGGLSSVAVAEKMDAEEQEGPATENAERKSKRVRRANTRYGTNFYRHFDSDDSDLD